MDHAPSHINTLSNEQLDDEELRIAGFQRFLETVQRHLLDAMPINVQFTSLTRSAHVLSEIEKKQDFEEVASLGGRRNSTSIQQEKLSRDMKPSIITLAMQHPSLGVKFGNRRWHLKLYERVFIGFEAVDWMLRTFSDIESREDAVAFGNALLQTGIFVHVSRRHGFMDGHYFYQLRPNLYAKQEDFEDRPSILASWFRSRNNSNEEVEKGLIGLGSTQLAFTETGSVSGQKGSSSIHTTNPIFGKPFEISRKYNMNLDLGHKSERKQHAILHIDTLYNAKHCFSFQLHWLNCTSSMIADVLAQWGRTAERCALRLLQAPIDQPKLLKDESSLHAHTVIHFAFAPPQYDLPEGSSPLFFESAVVKHFGFVLDCEADEKFPEGSVKYSYSRRDAKYTQYVHRSGLVFIILRPHTEGLIWIQNHLSLTISNPHFLGRTAAGQSQSQLQSHSQHSFNSHLNQSQKSNVSSPSLLAPGGSIEVDIPPLYSPKECDRSGAINCEILKASFISFCSDSAQMSAFWSDLIQKVRATPVASGLIEELAKAPETMLVTIGVPVSSDENVKNSPLPAQTTPTSIPNSVKDDDAKSPSNSTL
jgi:hypothetical protein